MTSIRRALPTLVVAVLLLAPPAAVHGRIGVAEWELYTPGGHRISDTDSQDPTETPCLRTDAQPDDGRAAIVVARLKRWRYQADHVVGEAEGGYFVFNESTGELTRPGSEAEFETTLKKLGRSGSPWMTAADGWREAWFPFMVWRPCRVLLGGPGEAAEMGLTEEQVDVLLRANADFLSESKCKEMMDREWLELYRRTTWGRMCRKWEAEAKAAPSDAAFLERFCDELLAVVP